MKPLLSASALAAALLLLPLSSAFAGAIPVDEDGDGFNAEIDCDDDDPDVNPDAVEVCDDDIDNDCDGQDDQAEVDADEDGHFPLCAEGGDDCDDTNARISPSDREVCDDAIDQDCDGRDTLSTDDLDGDGEAPDVCAGGTDCDDSDPVLNSADADEDAVTTCNGDCDDDDADAAPGLDEVCTDGIDNDCSGGVDDIDLDDDGSISPDCGGDDCNDENPGISPSATENEATCADEVDNDCDGTIDEGDEDCFQAPVVDAGDPVHDRYLGGTIVAVLDGTGTRDANIGDTLTYTWSLLTPADQYPGTTVELVTDPTSPVAYLRFKADPGTEQTSWVFDAQLVVFDGVFTTDPEDEDHGNANVRVEIWRPTSFPVPACAALAPQRPSFLGAALLLGLLGLVRRRV